MEKSLNKFLHHVIDAFNPELEKPKRERCVFASRDYVASVTRMCELEGTFFIREHQFTDGLIKYFLIKLK